MKELVDRLVTNEARIQDIINQRRAYRFESTIYSYGIFPSIASIRKKLAKIRGFFQRRRGGFDCDAQLRNHSKCITRYRTESDSSKCLSRHSGCIGLVYDFPVMGEPLTQRVTGIDFLEKALEWLEEQKKGIFLLGGKG